MDLMSGMLLYILFLVSGILTFLLYDLYKEYKRKNDRD